MPAARGKSKSKVSGDCSSFRRVLLPCRKPFLSLLPHGDTAKTWSLVSFRHLRGWEREQGALSSFLSVRLAFHLFSQHLQGLCLSSLPREKTRDTVISQGGHECLGGTCWGRGLDVVFRS